MPLDNLAKKCLFRSVALSPSFREMPYLPALNAPRPDPDHASKIIKAAIGMQEILKGQKFAHGLDFNTRIIVSENTLALLDKDAFPFKALGEVAVRGLAKPIRIYTLVTDILAR